MPEPPVTRAAARTDVIETPREIMPPASNRPHLAPARPVVETELFTVPPGPVEKPALPQPKISSAGFLAAAVSSEPVSRTVTTVGTFGESAVAPPAAGRRTTASTAFGSAAAVSSQPAPRPPVTKASFDAVVVKPADTPAAARSGAISGFSLRSKSSTNPVLPTQKKRGGCKSKARSF